MKNRANEPPAEAEWEVEKVLSEATGEKNLVHEFSVKKGLKTKGDPWSM